MAGKGSVLINFRANADAAIRETKKLTNNLNDVNGKAKKAGSGLSKMAKVGIASVAAGAAAAGVALVGMVEAAVADDAAQRRLARSLKNTTKATDKQVESVEDWISKQGIAYGITDDQLRPALDRLVRSTKDVAEAQDLATLAIDIAAGTGKDYNTVAVALAKANDGQIVALKKLGITLGDNAENAQEYNKVQEKLALANGDAAAALAEFGPKSKEYEKAMDKVNLLQADSIVLMKAGIDWQGELSDSFAEQGADQAASAEGAMARVKLAFTEAGEAVGASLLPSLQQLADWLSSPEGTQAIEDFGQAMEDLGPILTVEVPAFFDQLSDELTGPGSLYENLMQIQDLLAKVTNFFRRGGVGDPWGRLDVDPLPAGNTPRPTGRGQTRSNGTVNVTINNPKTESAADSAALALRLTRNLR